MEEKRNQKAIIKSNYKFPSKNKAVWIIILENKEILENLLEWLKVIPSNFIIISGEDIENKDKNIIIKKEIKNDLLKWVDFIVADNWVDNLKSYFENGIVPIVKQDNHMSTILEEFDPIKNSWNSYKYTFDSSFDIFYAITRYLENYKFPFDNRNLVKNLMEIA